MGGRLLKQEAFLFSSPNTSGGIWEYDKIVKRRHVDSWRAALSSGLREGNRKNQILDWKRE